MLVFNKSLSNEISLLIFVVVSQWCQQIFLNLSMSKVENRTSKGIFELLDDMQHSTDYNKAYKLSFDSIPDC